MKAKHNNHTIINDKESKSVHMVCTDEISNDPDLLCSTVTVTRITNSCNDKQVP